MDADNDNDTPEAPLQNPRAVFRPDLPTGSNSFAIFVDTEDSIDLETEDDDDITIE